MKYPPKPKWAAVLLFALALVLLTPGFYGNAWGAAGKKWFVDWQKLSEHFVVARLVQTRHTGIFSYGALLGDGDITTASGINLDLVNHEYKLFVNGGQFNAYLPYQSAPGLQAIPFSIIDQYFGLAPVTNIKLYHLLEALMAALVLGLFSVWVFSEFGFVSALATLIFMTASEWMTLFGGNFYWNLWAFYVPLTALCFHLQHSKPDRKSIQRDTFLLLAFALFIKGIFNGFEFISTTLIMPFTVLVYYALRQRWSLKDFLHRFVSAALGALTGSIAALGILIIQITSISGNWTQAIGFITYTLGKRSLGDPAQYSGREAESLRANIFEVLQTYMNGRALNLNSIFQVNWPDLEFSYLEIFALFAFFTFLFILRDRLWGGFPKQRMGYALLTATWFSTLAPLSWLILFRAHSYIHTQLNFIIWQMPFTLFGFALCGFILSNLFKRNPVIEKTA